MESAVRVEEATVGGSVKLLGRTSSSREEWEAAREADARDLNRLLEAGGEVEAYVVPLWSNRDVERCLAELRGFDEARVYVAPASGEGQDAALAAIAESEWAGAAFISPLLSGGDGGSAEGGNAKTVMTKSAGVASQVEGGEGLPNLAQFLYACAGLEAPLYVEGFDRALIERALALALGEDLSPREIESVLRGESTAEPDEDSLDHARELLS